MPPPETAPAPRLDLRQGTQRVFVHLLVNNGVVSVLNCTVWFAVTFWVFLQTRSVFATGMIAGIFVVATAATGIWFGSLVDDHHERTVVQASALASFAVYAVCLPLCVLSPPAAFRDVASWRLWVFVVLLVLGVIAGNPRSIALPTLVTLLVPADRRDRANGLVGTVSGASMLVTSVISGVLVATGGMLHVLLLALVVLAAAVLHLARVRFPETRVVASGDGSPGGPTGGVDLRGTWRLVRGVPGLVPLIAFSCFNNFIAGGFMALMDAYGLSLVGAGVGTAVGWAQRLHDRRRAPRRPARAGAPPRAGPAARERGRLDRDGAVPPGVLDRHPHRRDDRVHGADALGGGGRADRPAAGGALRAPGPGVRVAQSVEQGAAPVTAFLIGPLTQFVVVPFMTDGAGAAAIGGWFGTGQVRAIALVFVVIGVLGLLATLAALVSPQYRALASSYTRAPAGSTTPAG